MFRFPPKFIAIMAAHPRPSWSLESWIMRADHLAQPPLVTNEETAGHGPKDLSEHWYHVRTCWGTLHLPWSVLNGSPTVLCSSGFYSRCNISYLEEWLKDKNLQNNLAKETLEPLSQAAWLLQVKKTTDSDAKEISERCTSLSAVQVVGFVQCLPDRHQQLTWLASSFLA